MDLYEVANRYQNAKERFLHEVEKLEEEYMMSKYNIKIGSVVRFQNDFFQPTLVVVDKIFFLNKDRFKERSSILQGNVSIQGHVVDEEGYNERFSPWGNQLNTAQFHVEDVFEITNIVYKNRFR